MATRVINIPAGTQYKPKGVPHSVDSMIYSTKAEAQAKVREFRASGKRASIHKIQPEYYGWSLIKDPALKGWYFVFIREDAVPLESQKQSQPVAEPSSSPPPSGLPVVSSPLKPMVDEAKASTQQDLLGRLQALAPSQFEHLVAEYLKRKGITHIKVTGRPGDGGVDGEGEIPFLKLRVAFQAKRYGSDNSIGANPIRNFKGGVVGKYDRGVFITTSSFTPGAMEEINNPGVVIIPVDGNQLVKEMKDMQLGVKHIAVSVAIDEDFFKGLGG